MLVAGSRLPFESLQTPKLSAAALHCVLLGVQECRLPAFKALNPPQQPYTLSCWSFKSAVCRPSIGSTLRSGPYTALSCSNGSTLRSDATHCLVEGSRLQTPKRSAAALHTVLLTLQGYHLRASQLPTPYTLSCWGCKSASLQTPKRSAAGPTQCFAEASTQNSRCQPSNASTLRSGLTHSIVGAFRRLPAFRRVLFAAALHILPLAVHECRLPAFRPLFKTVKPSAAALQTVLLRLQDHRLLAFNP